MSDLAAPGKGLKLRKRERCRAGDHAINGEAPVSETGLLQVLKSIAQGSHFVRERGFRNLAGGELTGQRVASEDAVCSISERFARAVDATTIGRYESMMLGKPRSHGEPGRTGSRCESGGDEFTS